MNTTDTLHSPNKPDPDRNGPLVAIITFALAASVSSGLGSFEAFLPCWVVLFAIGYGIFCK